MPARAPACRPPSPALPQLPASLGAISGLRLLDVSHNMLMKLPTSTAELQQLHSLKVGRLRHTDGHTHTHSHRHDPHPQSTRPQTAEWPGLPSPALQPAAPRPEHCAPRRARTPACVHSRAPLRRRRAPAPPSPSREQVMVPATRACRTHALPPARRLTTASRSCRLGCAASHGWRSCTWQTTRSRRVQGAGSQGDAASPQGPSRGTHGWLPADGRASGLVRSAHRRAELLP